MKLDRREKQLEADHINIGTTDEGKNGHTKERETKKRLNDIWNYRSYE